LAIEEYKKREERYMNNASNSVKIGPLACAPMVFVTSISHNIG
jgi:hypothetical protein